MESWKSELYHAVPIGSIPEEDRKYGIPEQKKFPMPDKQHVISAIKFFNYVTPKYEKQLAKAILARMKEYGMSFDDFGVGEDNRFSKYIPKKDQELAHHGILGMKWGVRRFQNKDGSLTEAGQKRYSQKEAPVKTKYGVTNGSFSKEKYRKSIDDLNNKIDSLHISDNDKKDLKHIFNVEREMRGWKRDTHYGTIDDPEMHELLTMEYRETRDASNNIKNKYKSEEVNSVIDGIKKFDTYTDGRFSDYKKGNEYMFEDDFTKIYENGLKGKELKHHGILGQKWGVRRYQNPDGSLTPAGMKRRAQQIDKDNAKFLKKYGDTINKKVEKAVEPYMKIYAERELNTSLRKLKKNGRDSRNYINAYNKRLAQLMNTAVGDLRNPKTDYVVQFIAKRGEYGVHTALAHPDADMSRYKSGVYGDGRIAYRKEGVKTV